MAEEPTIVDGRIALLIVTCLVWVVTFISHYIIIYHTCKTSRHSEPGNNNTKILYRRDVLSRCLRYFSILDVIVATIHAVPLLMIGLGKVSRTVSDEGTIQSLSKGVFDDEERKCISIDVGTTSVFAGLLFIAGCSASFRDYILLTGVDSGYKYSVGQTQCWRVVKIVVLFVIAMLLTVPGRYEPALSLERLHFRSPVVCFDVDERFVLSPYVGIIGTLVTVVLVHLMAFIERRGWQRLYNIHLSHFTDSDTPLISIDEESKSSEKVADQSSRYGVLLYYVRLCTYPMLAVLANPWFILLFAPKTGTIMNSIMFYSVQIIYPLLYSQCPGIFRIIRTLRKVEEY